MRALHRSRSPRVALAGLLIAAALLAGTPADAQRNKGADPELQTRETATLVAGEAAWVALNWLGTGEATDVRVRAENIRGSNEASWGYPTNTGDYTAPARDATLQDGELDYTALQITVPYRQDKKFKLDLRVTWNDDRGARSESYSVTVPVTTFDGEDVKQVTSDVQVFSEEDTWVEVAYTGGAPRIEDFSARVVGDTQGVVVYPGDDDATSLHHDDVLLADETDVVRFLVLTSDMPPGDHDFQVEVSYTKGNDQITETFDLTAEVR